MARSNPKARTAQQAAPVKVWDIPTRFFHWTLVSLMAMSWFTADRGLIKLHMWSGLSVLTALVFRVIWGFIGSTTARFSHFLHPPSKIIGYFQALMSKNKPLYAGHNPAGGLMVMALLAILFAQVATGLFANDGMRFNGPLALWVTAEMSDRLTRLHGSIFNAILLLVWMHLVAVFFYWFVKGDNLVKPMMTGYKHRDHLPPQLDLKFARPFLALLALAAAAGVVGLLAL